MRFGLAHPPALGLPTAELWLWIHLRQRVEHVCAKKRAVIAMTALAILLMPNSYDYPLVKSLIAMPNMTTL